MAYITVRTREAKSTVGVYPTIVLDERTYISLVDVRIPEEVARKFTFTDRQAISTIPREGEPKLLFFPRGEYNIARLQHTIKNSPVFNDIGFDVEGTIVSMGSVAVRTTPELAQMLDIPESLPPFSRVTIGGGPQRRYLISCNLVETSSSYSSGPQSESKVTPSRLLAVAPSRGGHYPELLVQSGKNIVDGITLDLLTENCEVPDFGGKVIVYILKIR